MIGLFKIMAEDVDALVQAGSGPTSRRAGPPSDGKIELG
jgi:hypothetical protein